MSGASMSVLTKPAFVSRPVLLRTFFLLAICVLRSEYVRANASACVFAYLPLFVVGLLPTSRPRSFERSREDPMPLHYPLVKTSLLSKAVPGCDFRLPIFALVLAGLAV